MAQLDVLDTAGSQLRVGYDAAHYAEFSVGSTGDLTIAPTGGDTAITGNATVSGVLVMSGGISTGASAGEVVLGYGHYLRGKDAAGTGTRRLLGVSNAGIEAVFLGDPDIPTAGAGVSTAVGSGAGDLVLANGASLRGANAAGTTTVPVIGLDSADSIVLGGQGTITRHWYQPVGTTPSAATARNGFIGIDSTNNRLFYFSGGARYYLTGTSF